MQSRGGLLGFTVAITLPGQSLVVVVDRDREHFLGGVLTHDLLIQEGLDFLRPWDGGQGRSRFATFACGGSGFPVLFSALTGTALAVDQLFVEDLVAQVDAFVADVNAWASDQLADLILRFPAE